jgi:hypothetical protein
MNCPSCKHQHTRVLDTDRVADGIRRYRSCRNCGHRFATLERIEDWDPVMGGYAPAAGAIAPALAAVPDPELQPEPAAAQRVNNRRWHPVGVPVGVCEEAAPLLLEWWNESRRLKHKGNAVWSEKAWLASVERVKALPPVQQVALCQAGVEQGWQALKSEYIKDELARPTAAGRPMPKDPAMLAALEQWPSQTA